VSVVVKLEPSGVTAMVEGGEWVCEDLELAQQLRQLGSIWRYDRASTYDPDPDYHEAENAVRLLGGTIVRADTIPYQPDQVY